MIVEPRVFDLASRTACGSRRACARSGRRRRSLGPRPTNACHITGSTALAVSPSDDASVWIGRQPRNVCPSSATIRSKSSIAEPLLGRVGRGEERTDAVVFGLGQLDPQRPAPRDEELVGDLDQDAGAVAGVVLAAAGAAVVQVDERRQAVADQLVRFPPLQVDDEARRRSYRARCAGRRGPGPVVDLDSSMFVLR